MTGPKIIKSLERGLTVLQALQMQPNSSLHELYIITRISKPSLLRILYTLLRSGVVTRRLGDGRYRIGSNLSHTPSRREHRDRIAEAAAPILVRLCRTRIVAVRSNGACRRSHGNSGNVAHSEPNLVAAGAHWTASRLAFDCSRAGLSRLLSRQGASTCGSICCARRPDLKIAWRASPSGWNAILAETRARGTASGTIAILAAIMVDLRMRTVCWQSLFHYATERGFLGRLTCFGCALLTASKHSQLSICKTCKLQRLRSQVP